MCWHLFLTAGWAFHLFWFTPHSAWNMKPVLLLSGRTAFSSSTHWAVHYRLWGQNKTAEGSYLLLTVVRTPQSWQNCDPDQEGRSKHAPDFCPSLGSHGPFVGFTQHSSTRLLHSLTPFVVTTSQTCRRTENRFYLADRCPFFFFFTVQLTKARLWAARSPDRLWEIMRVFKAGALIEDAAVCVTRPCLSFRYCVRGYC